MKAYERFLCYVTFDTESVAGSHTFPSTPKQKLLAQALVDEMKALGIDDAEMDANGYVYGTIRPSKGSETKPGFALVAHMDTSPDVSGKDVRAKIVNYEGGDIILNEEKNIITKAALFPELDKHVGEKLIVTDGTTLLGADDKAGIAEIMTMAELMLSDDSFKHPLIQIIFTPDEEVGAGVDKIDMSKIKVNVGYTVDGGDVSTFQYETFNASHAIVTIHGIPVHPGYAKGKMKNACLMAVEFSELLPKYEIPYTTSGREGFYHLFSMNGNSEKVILEYMLRDHDGEILKAREDKLREAVIYMNKKYGYEAVQLEIKQMYRNMGEKVVEHPEIIKAAIEAIEQNGVNVNIEAVRGGTDGSRLSFMGLVCPNLPTGGNNGHSRHEFVSIEDLDRCTSILIKLAEILA